MLQTRIHLSPFALSLHALNNIEIHTTGYCRLYVCALLEYIYLKTLCTKPTNKKKVIGSRRQKEHKKNIIVMMMMMINLVDVIKCFRLKTISFIDSFLMLYVCMYMWTSLIVFVSWVICSLTIGRHPSDNWFISQAMCQNSITKK